MLLLARCCNRFAAVSRAAVRAGAARLQSVGIGRIHPDWARRASACERCPLRVIHRDVSYCGTPFLSRIDRDPVTDGCGCPCAAKAKLRDEHCPIDLKLCSAVRTNSQCSCKWCDL